MHTKALILAAIIAYVEARFGQEQVPIAAIQDVTSGGDPGQAATIAGAAISDILGAANSCAKLQRADQIIQELGDGADAVAAAIGMVTAEKNTNPDANGNAQNVCNDPTLPASEQLRGITPLIDPAVDVDGDVAALSQQSAASPLDATGKSVFDLLNDAGLGDLVVAQDADGNAAAGNAAAGNNNNNNDDNAAAGNNNSDNNNAAADDDTAADDEDCSNATDASDNANSGNANAGNANATDTSNNANTGNANAGNDNAGNANAGDAAAGASSVAGADFGDCTPTIIFEGGLGGRSADEFTFQIADELARGGQQEALNPNIITNALCNQLTNVCNANDAAIAACEDGKAQVQALGTRDKNTADTFNAAVGFAGAVTNPDGGPDDVSAAAKRVVRMRSFRY